jgi:hypothetical protein
MHFAARLEREGAIGTTPPTGMATPAWQGLVAA